VTFVLWLQRDPSRALDNAIAMLVVTCPCALALATPLAVSVAIGRGARQGILIRGGDALETLATPATLVLDKTGTITEGRLALVHWDGDAAAQPLVAALEQSSRHPVADAFARVWPHPAVATVEGVREEIGYGVRGTVNGAAVVVGRPDYVARLCGGVVPTWPERERSLTPVLVAVNGAVVGRALFGDPLRKESLAAVRDLRARGWDVRVLSGDDADVVQAAGRALGLPPESCRGGTTPEGKREEVERLRRLGPVVMVGDGVNDASAIAAATVGIGVHGGAEACLAAADVFLARAGLGPLVELEQGARRTTRLIKWGIGTSLAYNILGAALAFTGVMDPLIAAVAMPISSLTVVLVAWRGRTFTGARV
jgi:Cu2+-exporting ATPase